MGNVADLISSRRKDGLGTLIGYFPAGYPTLEESIEAAVVMCENGVDVLELGVPYSDPVMDGPIIQAATVDALENGFRLSDLFDAIRKIKARVTTPVLVMSYWNPILQFGVKKFAQELKDSGCDGLITPDLIFDEASEWLNVSDDLDLERVFLATPTSTDARASKIAELSRGFVYCVSTMGTTGARDDLDANARAVVSKVRDSGYSQNAAVGIGISTAAQVAEVNEYADAAIVGSVFVRAYASGGLQELSKITREIAKGKESNK
jgi:tryptophan synthase alpha chain